MLKIIAAYKPTKVGPIAGSALSSEISRQKLYLGLNLSLQASHMKIILNQISQPTTRRWVVRQKNNARPVVIG